MDGDGRGGGESVFTPQSVPWRGPGGAPPHPASPLLWRTPAVRRPAFGVSTAHNAGRVCSCRGRTGVPPLQRVLRLLECLSLPRLQPQGDVHKLGGLKQHTFILLQFWRSEFSNQTHWAKVKVSVGLAPSGRSEGSISLPCLFWLPWAPAFLSSDPFPLCLLRPL